MTHANAMFQVKGWDEKTWDGKGTKEVAGRKFTLAVIKHAYQGDLEGEGTAELLMFYRDDGTASYIGMEAIVGRLGGKSGSFALEVTGSFADSTATATTRVVPGSGTGELAGLRGTGTSVAIGQQDAYPMTLDYEFG